MADGTLKVGTITNSAGSGNITIGSGVTLLSNVPAFEAYLSSNQTISNASNTKLEIDTEILIQIIVMIILPIIVSLQLLLENITYMLQ